jgi:hypothetical protein
MSMTKRLDALEAELDRQSGNANMRVIIINDGETEADARERCGLTDHKGLVICITAEDATVI